VKQGESTNSSQTITSLESFE